MTDQILTASFRDLKAAMKAAGIRGDMDRKCKVAGNPIGGATMQENALRIIEAEGKTDLVLAALGNPGSAKLAVAAAVAGIPQSTIPKAPVPQAAVQALQTARETLAPESNVIPIRQPEASPAASFDVRVVRTEPASKVFKIRSALVKDFGDVEVWNDPLAPEVDPLYRFDPKQLISALSAIRRGRNTWLAGPAGTGKTEFVKNLAAYLGRNFARCNFDAGAEKYEFLGGEKAKNGSTVWQDGNILRAFRRPGSIILLDEVSIGRPEFIAPLHAPLEPHGEIVVNETGERVKKASGVCFFAADNSNGRGDLSGQFPGVKEQNSAFVDRWSRTINFKHLPKATEVRILVDRTGCTPALAALIHDFVSVCRTQAQAAALDQAPGMRSMIYLAEALTDTTDYRLAFEEVIVNKATADSQEVLQQLWAANLSNEMIHNAKGCTDPLPPESDE